MTTFHFPESLPAGAVLENLYRIDAVLGEGGMADVYAGRKLDLDVPVAVKVLKPIVDPERRARFQERFLKEAQLAARMNHPNVVRILGFHSTMALRLLDGQEATFDRPYLVMEHLDGMDLDATLVAEGPMAPRRVWELARGALAGLARGHELGIVHKDIKPQNLFLVAARGREAEALRILDFGIARVTDDQTKSTRTGENWCTPSYAAPEYIEEGTVSPALDVYQMGLVIAEMLTGTAVVDVDQPFRCFLAHAEGVELPTSLVGSPFESPLRKAMALSPGERFADAGAFLDALEALDQAAIGAMAPLAASPRTTANPAAMAATRASVPTPTVAAKPEPEPESEPQPKKPPLATQDTVAVSQSTSPVAEHADQVAPTPPNRWLPAILGVVSIALVAGVVATRLAETPSPPHRTAIAGPDATRSPSAPHAPTADVSAPSPPAPDGPCGTGETRVGRTCVPVGMAFMSGGSTWFGCQPGDTLCSPDEKPGKTITLSAFLVDETEVSVKAYRACVAAKKCDPPSITEGQHYSWSTPNGGDMPVNGVTWEQARRYCAWLDKRLPTEAEWETLARGHQRKRYPWGNTIPPQRKASNLADESGHRAFGWPGFLADYDDGYPGLAPVHKTYATLRTIRGLGGNVSEWVGDCYTADALARATKDPLVDAPDCKARVARGAYFGGWTRAGPRSSNRSRFPAGHARFSIGFRCARSLAKTP